MTDSPTRGHETIAPVVPVSSEQLAFVPLGLDAVRVTGGFWGDWQRANRAVTAPHALHWLEQDGAIDAFRRVRSGTPLDAKARPSLWFSDSDLYKALEGLAWDLGNREHGDFAAIISDLSRTISGAQDADGYINTFIQEGNGERWTGLGWSHEMYCIGHLVQAAVAHKRTTGSDELLGIARAAADRLVAEFGDGRRHGLDGHPEIEMALVELYRLSGERAYLQLAEQFIDERGRGTISTDGPFDSEYYQDATPVRDEHTTVGHAVRAVYLLCGVVDLYTETGEPALLDAAVRQWESMTSTKTYLNGAIGSRIEGEAFGDAYELPPDLVYGETCATIGVVMLSWRLLLVTGESRFADSMERGLFNLLAASTSVGRDSFFYSNPAQRRTPRPGAPVGERAPRSDAPGTRPAWFVCTCCPPNILRTIASLSAYVSTADSEGVQIHQYIPSTIDVSVADGPVSLQLDTDYPADGAVRVQVGATPDAAWSLSLRQPDWAERASLRVNGESVSPGSAKGYLVITRAWAVGDVVELDLPVEPRFTVPHPKADAVHGQVALERGPIVYALESTDQETGIDINAVEILLDEPVREQRLSDLLGQPAVVLQLAAMQRDDRDWEGGWAAYRGGSTSPARRVTLTAIPYHLWANRGPSVMRIFAPVHPS
jgi:DUF1680 family protein